MRRSLRRNRVVLLAARAHVLWRHRSSVRRRPAPSLRYLLRGRELSTFTYDLANEDALAAFVGSALGVEAKAVARYIEELQRDDELRDALAVRLRTHPNRYDRPRYAKRTGYYALVRLVRPQVVVETGTHDGVGTAVVARALQRNEQQGGGGRVLTFDVNPEAGWAVPHFLAPYVRRFTGPTRETLAPALAGTRVDVFIHDSLRTPENERFEFETAIRHARGPKLYLATDHAPDTYVLRDLCRGRGAWYGAFHERPRDHFFEGVELGLGVVELRG